MAVDFKYRAFISYSHADHTSAVWLHRALEKYPIHKKLTGLQSPAGKPSRRLGRVFRDEAEIGAVPELGSKIEAALQSSDTLIVLCSPNSAQSEWVAKEITRFKELGRQNRVLALILDGEPNAMDPTQECFPEPLKRNPDGTAVQPLAVDIRKFGREDALVRIVSGILDIDYDQLKQRDVQRRRAEMRRAQALFAAGLVLLVSALGAGFLALRGFSELAHAKSDILAREAKVIFDNGEGDKAKSLLMALQADPSARRTMLRQAFSGRDGYPLARARLSSALASRRLQHIVRGHTDDLDDVAFAPDGNSFATSSWDGSVKIWDATSYELLRSKQGGEGFGYAVAYAADGTAIYVAHDQVIQKWDLITDQMTPLASEHSGSIVALALSPNGQWLASASWDGTAKIWDLSTLQVSLSLDDHIGSVSAVAFSPDSANVATGSGDMGVGVAKIWQVATGTLQQTLSGHSDLVSALDYSADGSVIATGSGDNTVRIWDLTQGNVRYLLTGHQDLVSGVSFSPDDTVLVSASADQTARLWDPFSGNLITTLKGHQGELQSVAFAPHDDRLVTAAADDTARIWKVRTGEIATGLSTPGQALLLGAISSVDYNPDGSDLVTSHRQSWAAVWDAESGELQNLIGNNDGRINTAAIAPDGLTVATGQANATIRIWDKQSGENVTALIGHAAEVKALDYTPDGSLLISGDADGYAVIWDVDNGRLQSIIPTGTAGIDQLMIAPTGQIFATVNNAGEAVTWDIATGAKITQINDPLDFVTSLDFSPDGESIVIGTGEGQVREWDLSTNLLRTTYAATGFSVWSVDYSPDGTFLIAGTGFTEDGHIKMWDTQTGEPITEFISNFLPVRHVAIAPNANAFLSNEPTGWGPEHIADIWTVPEVVRVTPSEQVRLACEALRDMAAPLHFTAADAQVYPVLTGEPVDPETGDFISPCLGILPEEAFAR